MAGSKKRFGGWLGEEVIWEESRLAQCSSGHACLSGAQTDSAGLGSAEDRIVEVACWARRGSAGHARMTLEYEAVVCRRSLKVQNSYPDQQQESLLLLY